jgi:hypothetical protein
LRITFFCNQETLAHHKSKSTAVQCSKIRMKSTKIRNKKGGPTSEAYSSSASKSNGDHSIHQPIQQQQQQGGPLLLLVCASGICACYLYFGTVQERIFAKGSTSLQEVGSITIFMLLLSCITNVLVAKLWIVISRRIHGTSENDTKKGTSVESELPLNHSCLFASKSVMQYVVDSISCRLFMN